MEGENILKNGIVLIRDNRIEDVGDAADISIPENAEVIDAYNTAKTKQSSGSDKIDAEIVEDVEDAPEKVLAS